MELETLMLLGEALGVDMVDLEEETASGTEEDLEAAPVEVTVAATVAATVAEMAAETVAEMAVETVEVTEMATDQAPEMAEMVEITTVVMEAGEGQPYPMIPLETETTSSTPK